MPPLSDASSGMLVEMLLRFSEPVTVAGALRANLQALKALGARRVHVHPVPGAAHIDARALEVELEAQSEEGCKLAESEGLILGVERNAPEHRLLIEPDTCARLLEAVPALSFVWDLNHTEAEHVEAFQALSHRLSLVHASDTPLPNTNHHLPIGRGNVDFQRASRNRRSADPRSRRATRVWWARIRCRRGPPRFARPAPRARPRA
jgi:sugar phosphate isomerase/epimerase